MCGIVFIGGTMPLCRFGTILRSNTPCALPQHMGLLKCKGGRSIRKGRISASYTTRPTDQYHCSSMEAGKTSWVSGILEQTPELCILPTMPNYLLRKFGPGVLTRMALIGARHSLTTIAPISSCKRASSEIRKRMHSLSRGNTSFTEYWIPVRDTDGISRANLAGAVHLERRTGML